MVRPKLLSYFLCNSTPRRVRYWFSSSLMVDFNFKNRLLRWFSWLLGSCFALLKIRNVSSMYLGVKHEDYNAWISRTPRNSWTGIGDRKNPSMVLLFICVAVSYILGPYTSYRVLLGSCRIIEVCVCFQRFLAFVLLIDWWKGNHFEAHKWVSFLSYLIFPINSKNWHSL